MEGNDENTVGPQEESMPEESISEEPVSDDPAGEDPISKNSGCETAMQMTHAHYFLLFLIHSFKVRPGPRIVSR